MSQLADRGPTVVAQGVFTTNEQSDGAIGDLRAVAGGDAAVVGVK
jgi:hypothetical protein